MNYLLSYKIEENFKSKGYTVELNNSKSSDYIKITNDNDKYGFKLVVRISDHDAMTGRSECADLQYTTSEMFSWVWKGRFESKFGFDGDDFDTTGDFEYDTEEERHNAVLSVIVAEINSKLYF